MVVFLWDEFRVLVTIYSVGRALASVGSKMPNYDITIFTLYRLSDPTIWYMWMSRAVINERVSDGQDGLHWA